ncbi:hypothetical protein QUB63_23160 [Microcoleus sp. ARI1-B5]|uniref:hypothetical protein n=1 Tax=unclassified Microcoleus TaxID=2642155 RepID=UPI002FD73D5A
MSSKASFPRLLRSGDAAVLGTIAVGSRLTATFARSLPRKNEIRCGRTQSRSYRGMRSGRANLMAYLKKL